MTRKYREDNERLVRKGNYWVRRPQAVPFRMTASDHLKDAAEILLGMVVFLSLFLGVPFLLWLIAGGMS